MATRRTNLGYTLIELLVVVAILAILASLILAVLGPVRSAARLTACLSNQRQVVAAMNVYRGDCRGRWPVRESGGTGKYLPDVASIDYWAPSTSQQSLEWLQLGNGDDLPLAIYVCPGTPGRKAPAPRPAYAFNGVDPAELRGSWGVNWDGTANWPNGTSAFAYDPNIPKTVQGGRAVLGDRPVSADGRTGHRNRVPIAYADGHVAVLTATGNRTQWNPGINGHHLLYAFDGYPVTGSAVDDSTGDDVFDGAGDGGDGMTPGRGSPQRAWLR